MYKILDHETNEHVIFETYEDACIFKGVNSKAAYKVKRNTKDRPKVFFAYNDYPGQYIYDWLKQNHLKIA